MDKLSDILDAVIDEVDKLTDNELQQEFETSKGGPVGRAIIEGEAFFRDYQAAGTTRYTMTMVNINKQVHNPLSLHNDFIGPLDALTATPSDENYIMAA